MPDRRTGRFLSLILRHRPEAAGITLDEHGWADVEELLAAVSKTRPLTRAGLEQIVAEDDKQRFAFNEDGTKLRACQGHSIPVDVQPAPAVPPETLYHGTAERSVESIGRQGLILGTRLYVHLSPDADTARRVGARHGRPVVYRVQTGRMAREGFAFFRAQNGVWLTGAVPPQYLERMEGPPPGGAPIGRKR